MNITWATAVYNRGGHTVTMLLPAGRGWWPGYLSCDDISNEYWTLTHAWLPFQGKGEERTESQLSMFLMVWGHSPHITWPTQTLTINTESSLLSPISSLIDSQRRTKRGAPHLLPQPLGGGVGLWCASPLSLSAFHVNKENLPDTYRMSYIILVCMSNMIFCIFAEGGRREDSGGGNLLD